MTRGRVLALVVLLALTGCGKKATVVLADIRGQGSTNKTPVLAAPGSFRVEYSWDCSKQALRGEKSTQGFAYTLFHANDETLAAEKPTHGATGADGKGSVDYTMLGNYYFSVNSGCDWRLKVVDT